MNSFYDTNCILVPKSKIAENGDYNLTGDRYLETVDYSNTKWPMVQLGEVCEIYQPKTITSKQIKDSGKYKVFGANGVIGYFDEYNHEDSEVALTCRGATCGTINFTNPKSWITGNAMVLKPKENNLNKKYLFYLLKNANLNSAISGAAQPQITRAGISPFQIPLPPLAVQEQIVAEIEQYQNVIDGAKQVVENWKPSFRIDPSWEMVELGEVCEVKSGGTPSRNINEYWNGNIPWVGSTVCKDKEVYEAEEFITELGLEKSSARLFKIDTTLIALVGATIGKTGLLKFKATTNQNIAGLYPNNINQLNPIYLFYVCQTLYNEFVRLGDFKMANLSFVKSRKIPLPPLAVQEQIVAEIEAEQKVVNANKELMEKMQKKVEAKIGEVWGE